jgi:hypothetical protein
MKTSRKYEENIQTMKTMLLLKLGNVANNKQVVLPTSNSGFCMMMKSASIKNNRKHDEKRKFNQVFCGMVMFVELF